MSFARARMRRSTFARASLGALALGLAGAGAIAAAPALAAEKAPAAMKLSLSKPFQQAAGPLQQGIAQAKARSDVAAATAKVQAAEAALDGARDNASRSQAQ